MAAMQPYTYRQSNADWNAVPPHDTAPMPRVTSEEPASPSQTAPQPRVQARTQASIQAQAYAQPQPRSRYYPDGGTSAPPAPSPHQPSAGQAGFSDGYPEDYEEYFWGEGTEVVRKRHGGCSVFIGLLLAVALAAMIWPQSPVNYDVLRGTSLDQLQDWFYDTFGIERPAPSEEELEAIYGQEARADSGYLVADPPTALDSVEAARHYYRSALDEHAQSVYDALEAGLINEDDRIAMPAGTTESELQTCWQFVLYDHPEVFNLPDDAHVTYWSWGNEISHLAPDYKYDQGTADAMEREYEDLAWTLPLLGETQEQTMENICAYVADSADYVNTDNDQYIDSVFTIHESVCAGYAKAVQFLALRHGIPCIYLTGSAEDFLGTGGSHAWIAAFVDGEVRYYDPTWFDQRGWHATQFLGMDVVEISADHQADYPQLLPR